MTSVILGPFNRVEGDLEVRLDIQDDRVEQAFVSAPLYRGFERILAGRPPEDALVIAPRICGICSVSQSVAAARALAGITGLSMPDNGRLAANLILACENAADHLTHFSLFFMPDFTRPLYAAKTWHASTNDRFAPQSGRHQRIYAQARARFLHIMGLLAGKWPHSLALQPGGLTKAVDSSERVRLMAAIGEFREILEQTLFGASLDQIAALASRADLETYRIQYPDSDFALFLTIAADLGLETLGIGPASFLSHGSFDLWAGGLLRNGQIQPFSPDDMSEDLTSAWMDGPTLPNADKADAYSWCKSPRIHGNAVEVGALARQRVAGHPLAVDLVKDGGASVLDRVVMRLVELARLIIAMQDWTRQLRLSDPWCLENPLPLRGSAFGLVEAARGSLSHQISLEAGIIRSYSIIAPTTWNFSPRDSQGQPGPLEQALAGTPLPGGDTTPIQHVVRSFDPCMVCTVH